MSIFGKGQKFESHLAHYHLLQVPMLVELQWSCLLTVTAIPVNPTDTSECLTNYAAQLSNGTFKIFDHLKTAQAHTIRNHTRTRFRVLYKGTSLTIIHRQDWRLKIYQGKKYPNSKFPAKTEEKKKNTKLQKYNSNPNSNPNLINRRLVTNINAAYNFRAAEWNFGDYD